MGLADIEGGAWDLVPDSKDEPPDVDLGPEGPGLGAAAPLEDAPDELSRADGEPAVEPRALEEGAGDPGSDSGPEDPPTVGYVVCITRRGRSRKLHHTRLCWRVPGVDYKTFECFGEVLPGPTIYNSICRKCWPKGLDDRAEKAGPAGDVSTDDESDTSSSGSS